MTTTWLPQGTVYGTLMNFACEHRALAAQMADAPYKAAPVAPVLFIKTANTFSAHGNAVVLPMQVREVQVRASMGLVFQSNMAKTKVNSAQTAPNYVANMVLMNDLTVPHTSFYRPPVKAKCIDGFLGVGQAAHAVDGLQSLDSLQITVRINGAIVQTFGLSDMVRKPAQLVADVAEFIDLQDGDVLMIGSPFDAPLAKAGDVIEISAPGFAPLRQTLVTA